MWLARRAGFEIRWVWYLSVGSQIFQACLSLFLLWRELRRKLVFAEAEYSRQLYPRCQFGELLESDFVTEMASRSGFFFSTSGKLAWVSSPSVFRVSGDRPPNEVPLIAPVIQENALFKRLSLGGDDDHIMFARRSGMKIPPSEGPGFGVSAHPT